MSIFLDTAAAEIEKQYQNSGKLASASVAVVICMCVHEIATCAVVRDALTASTPSHRQTQAFTIIDEFNNVR